MTTIWVVLVVLGITMCSHLLRGERATPCRNIGISDAALLTIMGMAGLRIGFGVDFWTDVFLTIVYSVCGTIELLGLLSALYEIASPLGKEEAGITEKDEWVEMEPRG